MNADIAKYIKNKYSHIKYSEIKKITEYYNIIKDNPINNTVDDAIVIYYIIEEANKAWMDLKRINKACAKLEKKFDSIHNCTPEPIMTYEEQEMIKCRVAVNKLIERGYAIQDAKDEVNKLLGNMIVLKAGKIQIIQQTMEIIMPLSKISKEIYNATYESIVI